MFPASIEGSRQGEKHGGDSGCWKSFLHNFFYINLPPPFPLNLSSTLEKLSLFLVRSTLIALAPLGKNGMDVLTGLQLTPLSETGQS